MHVTVVLLPISMPRVLYRTIAPAVGVWLMRIRMIWGVWYAGKGLDLSSVSYKIAKEEPSHQKA